jgi:hypothetical protein
MALKEKVVSPNHYTALEYVTKRPRYITLDLESDIPVATYIVRPKALQYYSDGSTTFKYYGGFPDPRMHQHQTLWLPFSGSWYLIVSNPDESREATIEYEVSF